jgi:hypothetical protein
MNSERDTLSVFATVESIAFRLAKNPACPPRLTLKNRTPRYQFPIRTVAKIFPLSGKKTTYLLTRGLPTAGFVIVVIRKVARSPCADNGGPELVE